jgi:hypothetical protein
MKFGTKLSWNPLPKAYFNIVPIVAKKQTNPIKNKIINITNFILLQNSATMLLSVEKFNKLA